MQLSEATVAELRAHGVAAAWQFGSTVQGAAHADSDIDVAVLLRAGVPAPALLERGRIADVLAAALGSADIDLVVLDEAPLELRAAVVGGGHLIVRIDEPRRVRFEVETLSRWFDVREALRAQDRAYLARISREGLP